MNAVPMELRQPMPRHVQRGSVIEYKGARFYIVRFSRSRRRVWVVPFDSSRQRR